MARARYTRSARTFCGLLSLSAFSTVNESSFQLALLVELALITRSLSTSSVAAYAAVASTTTCALGLFNFLLITTMAQVGKAVGAKRWAEIGTRFRWALLSAVVVGVVSAAVFWALEKPIFVHIMALDAPTVAEIHSVYPARLALLPFMMVQRVCTGLLGGYQRVEWLAARTVVIALAEILSQWLALYVLKAGLLGATLGSLVTAVFGAGLSLVLVAFLPPADARGQIQLCGGSAGEKGRALCCNFALASKDTVIRSVLLTLSVYSMSLFAASLGTAQLTAHQVAMTLWMLMSLICDGIADVGTMLSSRLLGEGGRTKEIRVVRDLLMLMGSAIGLLVSVLMWVFRDRIIITIFALKDPSTQLLVDVWPLLCAMQMVNAAVFVLDGFIYGVQAFSFVRNLMLLACIGWFGPALLCVDIPIVTRWRTLAAIWYCKAGLNAIRCVGALYLLYYKLPSAWRKEEEEEDATATLPA